ncbi:Helicase SWR1 [Golovinomyces cichoracearum]|uniref:DNA helicase n=1 Tax=Golovinomyces cichoracearum TaxID=62708 RepID=A0A420HSZ9_9PEZI|nr:Helicase SWR1 [Golovinomyces cichoracearum]
MKRAVIPPSERLPDETYNNQPPNKRRKLESKKPESPPWKTALADGPSSFTHEGKRRSGRMNSIPIELHTTSQKRFTRSSLKAKSLKSRRCDKDLKNGQAHPQKLQPDTPHLRNTTQKLGSYNLSCRSKATTKSTSLKFYNRKTPQNDPSTDSSQPTRDISSLKTQLNPIKISCSAKILKAEKNANHISSNKAKIRLRVKPSTLPLTHPGLVLPRPRKYSNLQEYFQYAGQDHINEGGLFCPEDSLDYSPDIALQDARILLRAEKASEPGGTLASGNCHIYKEVESSTKMPLQYSHLDHLCRAAIGFRKLIMIEQKNHRLLAKKTAEACAEEWFRRQPKTTKQIEAELILNCQSRYKSVIKTLQATWCNVIAEVNRQNILEWEAKEHARVRKALSDAVDKSHQQLQQRIVYMDTDVAIKHGGNISEIELDASDEINIGSESDNMEDTTSLDSEADQERHFPGISNDDELTVEELREKYAALSDLTSEWLDKEITNINLGRVAENNSSVEARPSLHNSDESVVMDEDLTSSDYLNEDSTDEDDGEVPENNLLGFFTRTELMASGQGKANIRTKTKSTEFTESDITIEDKPYLFVKKDNESNDEIEADGAQNESNIQTNCIDIKHNNNSLTENDLMSLTIDPTTSTKHGSKVMPSDTSGTKKQSVLPTIDIPISNVEPIIFSEIEPGDNEHAQVIAPQPDYQIRTQIPPLLRGTLREYQHYGLDWLAGLYANNMNGILADEMGLGKTIQTIALLAHLACVHEEWGPHLVIVPTSVMLNWEMEFKKWCPGLKIMTYYGSVEERKKKRIGWKNKDMWNVCITSYQLIVRDQQVFKRRRWHYMILDEAHNIKNFNSQRWQTMLTFKTRARLLLTGTPLQNNLTELWSLLYFLMPSDRTNQGVGGFADLKEFQDWFKKPSEQILEHGREKMDSESWGIITKLHQLLRPYLLRRLKADVEKQLPAKYEHIEYCHLSKRQRELYDGFLNRDDTRETLASGNTFSVINCLMQLRKVCNHPDLFIDRPISTSLPMEKSVVADYEIKDLIVRKRLLEEKPMNEVSLEFLNLIMIKNEGLSDFVASRTAALSAQRTVMETCKVQLLRAQNATIKFDPSTARSNLNFLESTLRWSRYDELQRFAYINAFRRQKKPIYGSKLVELLSFGINQYNPPPKRRDQIISWLENTSVVMKDLVKPISLQAEVYKEKIQRFACITPAVIAKDITSFTLTQRCFDALQGHMKISDPDPFHEARMRLSIQFPDKRLLQYDCGKLQTLDKLLRRLKAEGHRALIFTQMTKVLDILEQFLNIHGHKYLRLDGSTKIEQRQILTDLFNNDTRILAFILSSRSGGLGINLTGADSVIFYDLDWNPAMDKQCQDRCHRIGQTRDVHIYRLVSEHTIEANILRKANQKRMLDDVVIQEGDFTTDYLNRISVKDVINYETLLEGGNLAANAAMDRVFGEPSDKEVRDVLAQAEDQEDVIAARLAEREIFQINAADFDDNLVAAAETQIDCIADTLPKGRKVNPSHETMIEEICEDELNAWGDRIQSIDDYMLRLIKDQLKNESLDLPKDKTKSKKGKEHRIKRAK